MTCCVKQYHPARGYCSFPTKASYYAGVQAAKKVGGEEPVKVVPPPTDELGPEQSMHRITASKPAVAPYVVGRPPARALRFVKAYWVTFRVIASYLSARFQARFRSEASMQRLLRRKHLRNAKRVERAICSLQGLFIKVGQLISIMTNFLPQEFQKQMEGLQDHVPPRPYKDIEARFREEFDGQGPHDLFAEFDERAVASASIGQVHYATLRDGQSVAVKVQYPDIEELVRSDLKTLSRIFRITQYFVPYQGLEDVYREIRSMIMDELDFRQEAENTRRVAANFVGSRDVAFPKVIDELSTARVLTTRFEEGVKIGDLAALKEMGIDRKALARRVVELYCKQIFTDGVYHADPHPGNLLVRHSELNPEGFRVVFLDFGATAEVSPEMRQGLIELIQGALSRDTQRIVHAMRTMGFIARGADDRVFDQVVEYFHERFQQEISLDSFNLKDIKFDPEKGLENLADLRRMDISLRELSANFHVPKEWILLERALLLLMGLCTKLDPTMNPMAVIRPYLEHFVLGEEGDWSTFVMDTTKDLVMGVTALPGDIRKFIRSAHNGEIKVKIRDDRSTRMMYKVGQQAILAVVGISAVAFALVLEGRGEYDRADWAWWTARISGAWLAYSWWTARAWVRRRR